MQRFAHWTNLSETTFLLAADRPGAPTTGCGSSRPARSCRSPATRRSAARTPGWRPGECRGSTARSCRSAGAGCVRVRRAERLAFAAPPLMREGPVTDEERAAILRRWRLADDDVVDARWVDNGPGWVGVLLRDAEAVLAVRPDWSAFGDLDIGVVGPYPAGRGVRGRGARVLPEHRRRRGPGHRQPQRQHRPVAGRRPAARRRTSRRRAPCSADAAACTSSATATPSGSAATRQRRSRGPSVSATNVEPCSRLPRSWPGSSRCSTPRTPGRPSTCARSSTTTARCRPPTSRLC